MTKFPAHQLAEVEKELTDLGFHADRVALNVGDHSDAMHWDDAPMVDATGWLNEVTLMRGKLARAEGLLRAYELVRNTRNGESDDYPEAG